MDEGRPVKNFRNADRRGVAMNVRLRQAGGGSFDIEMLDLSQSGFRCETFFGLAVGARVFVTIPSFAPLEAVVAWKDSYTYGCRFENPLHIGVFDAIVARYPDRSTKNIR